MRARRSGALATGALVGIYRHYESSPPSLSVFIREPEPVSPVRFVKINYVSLKLFYQRINRLKNVAFDGPAMTLPEQGLRHETAAVRERIDSSRRYSAGAARRVNPSGSRIGLPIDSGPGSDRQ